MRKDRRAQPAPPSGKTLECMFCDEESVTLPPGMSSGPVDGICDDCMDRLGLDRCSHCGRTIDDDAEGDVCEEHRVRCQYDEDCDELVHPDPASPEGAMCSEHASKFKQERDRKITLERETALAPDTLAYKEAPDTPPRDRPDFSWDNPDDVPHLVELVLDRIEDHPVDAEDVCEFVGAPLAQAGSQIPVWVVPGNSSFHRSRRCAGSTLSRRRTVLEEAGTHWTPCSNCVPDEIAEVWRDIDW